MGTRQERPTATPTSEDFHKDPVLCYRWIRHGQRGGGIRGARPQIHHHQTGQATYSQLGQVFVHMSYITIHVCICDTFNNPTFWWHKSIVYANLISIFRVSIIKKKDWFFFIKQQANNNDHGHKKSADKICNKHLAVVRMARWNSFSFSRLPNGTLFFTPSTARINLRYD